jgi:DNA-binding transcriptional LysR family regulator
MKRGRTKPQANALGSARSFTSTWTPFTLPSNSGTIRSYGLVAENLYDERTLTVAGLHSRLARRRRIELSELVDEPWVLAPRDSVPGRITAEIFNTSGLEVPRAGMVTLSIHLDIALVASGRFIGMLPASVVRFNPGQSALKILPVKLPMYQPATVGVVTVRNRTISTLAQSFIDYARKVTVPLARFGRMQ